MHTTANKEFGAGPLPDHGPHCTREQARELLEGLRAACQSLLPDETDRDPRHRRAVGTSAFCTGIASDLNLCRWRICQVVVTLFHMTPVQREFRRVHSPSDECGSTHVPGERSHNVQVRRMDARISSGQFHLPMRTASKTCEQVSVPAASTRSVLEPSPVVAVFLWRTV